MKKTFIIAMLALVIVSCSDGERKSYLKEKHQEAMAWLESNHNPYAFASNHFGKKENALKFIRNLYKQGCIKVYVTGIYDEDWRIKEEGGPYADTLVVILPDDKQKRKTIFTIHAKEAISEGFSPEKDTGQKELLFWWD